MCTCRYTVRYMYTFVDHSIMRVGISNGTLIFANVVGEMIYHKTVRESHGCRVFSRDVVLGGKLLLWGEKNVKNIQKTNEICYCLGGKFKT